MFSVIKGGFGPRLVQKLPLFMRSKIEPIILIRLGSTSQFQLVFLDLAATKFTTFHVQTDRFQNLAFRPSIQYTCFASQRSLVRILRATEKWFAFSAFNKSFLAYAEIKKYISF